MHWDDDQDIYTYDDVGLCSTVLTNKPTFHGSNVHMCAHYGELCHEIESAQLRTAQSKN